ncbi:hypothetical protein VZ94_09090 [Methylocucumis oryzae]|uniref:Uncharacterized protein n=1 Tax=Methylocucumis oryzae TaxID=1632867 RepID=A0A0F3IMK1_9GAMM|nr:hypothetical protein VZ94_09090 [Methylocucumis oryzae]
MHGWAGYRQPLLDATIKRLSFVLMATNVRRDRVFRVQVLAAGMLPPSLQGCIYGVLYLEYPVPAKVCSGFD